MKLLEKGLIKGMGIAAMLAASLALSACGAGGILSPTGDLSPATQADIQADLNAACPIISALQPTIVAGFNSNVATAYKAVLLACPPNPPPTNVVVLGVDIFEAFTLLQPYLPGAKLALHRRHH